MNEVGSVNPVADRTLPERVARNTKLLLEDPRLFLRKLSTWLRPMRKEYRKRWNMRLRDWLILYHRDLVFQEVTWMGRPAWKNVLDAWIYQEIIYEVKPDVIIEIGNANGGSTQFLANMLDLIGKGKVLAVDIDHSRFSVEHPRIITITGDSVSAETLQQVEKHCTGAKSLVIHDGDHSREHVLADLRAYSNYVTQGSYLIVEDSVIGLFRAGDGLGSVNGPMGAIEQFIAENPDYAIDSRRERFILTFNPKSYLKKIR